jgi:glutamate formiminotransferase
VRYTFAVLECVVNISEGADKARLATLAESVGVDLLDLHSDADHNRSVFTLAGVEAPRILARTALEQLDISVHEGVHPRVGIVDVVPFVAIDPSTYDDALAARDDFARFASEDLGVPCFLYGPERTLPFIRKHAFVDLLPDFGPKTPHPNAGAMCVGARPILIAYNLWLKDCTLEVAKRISKELRSDSVRALGLQVGSHAQVSMNLIAPDVTGPDAVYDFVAERADIDFAELVGLVPARTLARIDRARWDQLDLSSDKTIESRLARRNQTRR